MSKGKRWPAVLAVLIALAIAAATTRGWWLPLVASSPIRANLEPDGASHHRVDSVKGLVLSDSAKASLGLELSPIEFREYWRHVPVPAEVMEEPGHCEQGVSSTIHGIVQKIYAFHGQTVRAGDPLFDLRPTSELLATTQSLLLKSIQEAELVQAELNRMAPLVEIGGIPANQFIEKKNELKRYESQRVLLAQELLVRGLSSEQIASIVESKTLIQKMTIFAPEGRQANDAQPNDHDSRAAENRSKKLNFATQVSATDTTMHEHSSIYSIEQLNVHLGKLVQPGDELCRLARHSQLLIAGRAFERENFLITRAIEKNWPVKAVFEVTDESPVIRDGLFILYSDNIVESDSRTIRFYVPLMNELVRDQPAANGISYRSWRFKPGQRAQVMLPVEHLLKQIVLPAEAVVKEGAESFVFRVNGKRLERVLVRILHLDSRDAVIKCDGTLMAGDVVATNQAYQLELALKNSQGGQSGGHAGHDHAGHSHAGHEH